MRNPTRRECILSVLLGLTLIALGIVWCMPPPLDEAFVSEVLAAKADNESNDHLRLIHPLDGTIVPREIVPLTFRWQDESGESDAWVVTFRFQDGGLPLSAATAVPQWTPDQQRWEAIKRRSENGAKATVTVLGVNRRRPTVILSRTRVSMSTSTDPVGASILCREIKPPFLAAVAHTESHVRWRYGGLSSDEGTKIIFESAPVCTNCHSFSSDGQVLGMDVDFLGDKGGYAIASVTEEIVLDEGNIISWSDCQRDDRPEKGGPIPNDELPLFSTAGGLPQVSPDGCHVVAAIDEIYVSQLMDNPKYSIRFYPIEGTLVVYSRETKKFDPLSGADDPRFVHANPTWSHDGKSIVFARCPVRSVEDWALDHANENVKYDLYQIPFSEGRGGEAEPLPGASDNQMSNFFPKFSPNGKWIVFCQANSFMFIEPDSQLFIIPAAGGNPRRLKCNTNGMNSWHSWSPNSKWLVFSSKAYSTWTQLLLTHIDEDGNSTPAFPLPQFGGDGWAANVPEFVDRDADAIRKISLRLPE